MGAALAADVDSHIFLLPADLARDAPDGPPERLRARKSLRCEWSRTRDFQSRDLSGRGVCAGGSAHALAPSACCGDGRRAPGGNAPAAGRIVFSTALAAAHELLLGCLPLQCVSTAEKIRVPRKLPFCRRSGRSRLEHSRISRG